MEKIDATAPYRDLLLAIYRDNIIGELMPLREQDIKLIEEMIESDCITEQERKVVRAYYGLGEKKLKLTEIGNGGIIRSTRYPEKEKFSEGRVIQIRNWALRKMYRPNKYSKKLSRLFRERLEVEVESLDDLYRRVRLLEERMAKLDPCQPIPEHMSIDDLDLSVRAYNCLRGAGILTVEKLAKTSATELRGLRNSGEKTIREINEKLAPFGRSLKP